MAKLPPKPMNIVHEYFPIGSESPMNKGAFDVYKELKGKRIKDKKAIGDGIILNSDKEDGDTLFNKNDDTMLYEIGPGKFEPGETPEEKAARILKLKADTNKATQEGLLKKIDTVKLKNVTVTGKKKRGSGKQLPNQYTLNGKQIFVKPGDPVPEGAVKAKR